MARPKAKPTGRVSFFDTEEIIVSKTDLKGHLTYTNEVFLRVAHLTEAEALGQPHNIIRHPDMPRCVFQLLWQQIQARKEIFAYVLNLAANGDHYWVFAHVTPSYDADWKMVGFHSNRRKPDDSQIAVIAPVYRALVEEEARHPSPKDGMANAGAMLADILKKAGKSYDEFIFSF